MKKVVIAFILGCALTASTNVFAKDIKEYVLTQIGYPIMVNGQEFKSDSLPALNYQGTTYLPLKSISDVLNVKVEWNKDLKQVEVGLSTVFATPTPPTLSPSPIFTPAPMPEMTPIPTPTPNVIKVTEDEEINKITGDYSYFKSIFKSGERELTKSNFIFTTAYYEGALGENSFFKYWDSLPEYTKKAYMISFTREIQSINPQYTIRIDFYYKKNGIDLGSCSINLTDGYVGAGIVPNPRGLQNDIK
ncbi:hypothetical protein EHS13_02190 [Paenibacillus psychroresistens]|uniref:Copper amine oxidase-like N-terminal domain-containing protein n=1 Tax=Paenibacillus psychroresistens TaxID=1778678 RepID=A0A6B8RCT9_9BACL|nr:stalk domain-containing protein [Paenibacillus psychroresistens]QGQ93797.1 hypothetical protein EHS13_02190 [Paenibacillus psychroresistens]